MRLGVAIQRLRRDTRSKWAMRLLALLVFLAVFGDFIANEKPLYCKVDGTHYFPLFRAALVDLGVASWPEPLAGGNWTNDNYERAVHTFIPYSPETIDANNGNYRSPFGPQEVRSWRFRHWLGTDSLGRDVLSGLIRGCRIALIVGLLSMAIAVMIGVPVGARAGYHGDDRQRMAWPILLMWLLLVVLVLWQLGQAAILFWQYGMATSGLVHLAIATLLVALGLGVERLVGSKLPDSMQVGTPWDFVVLRSIELIRGVPPFFLLFALLGLMTDPSILYVVLFIGILRVPTIIRYVRAEALNLRDQPFVDAARVIGLSDREIIRRHIVPNAIGPVMITVAFGIGSAVLLESGLSFLGIGLSIDQLSWGRLLSEARSNFGAWWLAVLPGAAILLTVTIFNRLGEVLTDQFEGAEEDLVRT